MIQIFFFFRAYYKKQFAKALANCSSFPRLETAYHLYTGYRLDMHQTVSAAPTYTRKNWRGGLARAISLAACGRKAEAEQQTSLWLKQPRSNKQKILLAKGLAAFHPELAQGLLENVPEAVLLRAGICQRLGRISQTRNLLATLSASGEDPAPPEYNLFLDNAAINLSPADRLAGLNRFLR